MRFVMAYIRERRWVLILLLLCCCIFTGSFLLYHLPVGAALYPSLLSFFAVLLFFFFDGRAVYRRHQKLELLQKSADLMLAELPEAGSLEGEDYQRLIAFLKRQIFDQGTAFDLRYSEMLEYYTVWAHQIKTPIASMRLTLQNEDTPLSRTLTADLFRVEQYVEMVMTYLRLDDDASDYVFKEYDIDRIVRQSVKKFSTEFINRRLSLDLEPMSLTAVTDEKWLSFVIGQLISNALKYTRSGGIRIYKSAPDTLCIADTGIGIAPEDLPRIFEKGYTGHNGREERRSSGLGLYLCRRICEKLGIGIKAASVIGRGTESTLRFERKKLRVE